MLLTKTILGKQTGSQYNQMAVLESSFESNGNPSKCENLTTAFQYIGLLISVKTR